MKRWQPPAALGTAGECRVHLRPESTVWLKIMETSAPQTAATPPDSKTMVCLIAEGRRTPVQHSPAAGPKADENLSARSFQTNNAMTVGTATMTPLANVWSSVQAQRTRPACRT